MSAAGSSFVQVSSPSTLDHGSSCSDPSESSMLTGKHVRVGRGFVKVSRYEHEASRGARQPPLSPTSPHFASSRADDDTAIGQVRKRKWYPACFRRRRCISLGDGLPGRLPMPPERPVISEENITRPVTSEENITIHEGQVYYPHVSAYKSVVETHVRCSHIRRPGRG
jgi:hypothetical protein